MDHILVTRFQSSSLPGQNLLGLGFDVIDRLPQTLGSRAWQKSSQNPLEP